MSILYILRNALQNGYFVTDVHVFFEVHRGSNEVTKLTQHWNDTWTPQNYGSVVFISRGLCVGEPL